MEKYKISNISPNEQYGMTVSLSQDGPANKRVMVFEREKMRLGGDFCILYNYSGHEYVYVFDGKLQFNSVPATDSGIRLYARNFPGLMDGSLERIRYKIALARALVKLGKIPSLSAHRNLRKYLIQKKDLYGRIK